MLLFETGVHWDAKQALKWFAFFLKFDISLKFIIAFSLKFIIHINNNSSNHG